MIYIYGMRNRSAGPGCQPDGFIEFTEGHGRYHNFLYYDRPLTSDEKKNFELDFVGANFGDSGVEFQKPFTESIIVTDFLSDEEFIRLCQLFEVKFPLESHSFGSPKMQLYRDNGHIYLKGLPQNDYLNVPVLDYLQALMNFAVTAKRVNHHKTDGTEGSEKYAFRLWLNRIGLSGPDYKETRKVLLANLSGSATRAHE